MLEEETCFNNELTGAGGKHRESFVTIKKKIAELIKL
jgi:hypothetical protein